MKKPGKPGASKRISLPRCSDHTKKFLDDWHRLTDAGRHNMEQLKEVMGLIVANDGPLPAEWKDHPLKGKWQDHRECHVGGDFLLIYAIDDKKNLAVFTRIGSHSELFG